MVSKSKRGRSHISIEPEADRKLKTRHARRKIPLTGVSLQAMRAFPEGFSAYRSNDKLLKVVSDFLTTAELRESTEHSLYSLRHSFNDRLLHGGVDERIGRDLMGHRLTRERYSDGTSLEHMRQLLEPLSH